MKEQDGQKVASSTPESREKGRRKPGRKPERKYLWGRGRMCRCILGRDQEVQETVQRAPRVKTKGMPLYKGTPLSTKVLRGRRPSGLAASLS